MKTLFPLFVLVLCLAAGVLAKDDSKPAGKAEKAGNDWHLSPAIVKDVKEVPVFLSASARTTLKDMGPTLGKIWEPLTKLAAKGTVRVAGPAMFIYRGCDGQPDKEFTLEVGFVVHAGTTDTEAYKPRSVAACQVVSAYYTGSAQNIGRAAGQLFGEVMRQGYQPTDEYREVYLFWEGPDSPNNVVELQVVIEPEKNG